MSCSRGGALVGCLALTLPSRGLFVYTVLNSLIWLVQRASGGMLEPREYDLKEYWTWKPAGKKPWLIRTVTRGRAWDGRPNSANDEEMVLGEDNESSIQMHERRMVLTTPSEEKGVDCVSTTPRVVMRGR